MLSLHTPPADCVWGREAGRRSCTRGSPKTGFKDGDSFDCFSIRSEPSGLSAEPEFYKGRGKNGGEGWGGECVSEFFRGGTRASHTQYLSTMRVQSSEVSPGLSPCAQSVPCLVHNDGVILQFYSSPEMLVCILQPLSCGKHPCCVGLSGLQAIRRP